MNNQKMLLGLFAGVAVGAAMGILFAPEKGSDIRRKISTKGNDYKNNLRDKFGNLVDSASGTVENVKSKINEFTGQSASGSGEFAGSTGGNSASGSNSGARKSQGAGTGSSM